jgi:hypothetical protein
MILFLCCNSVIEKAILYTSLSIAKPDNFEVCSSFAISDINKETPNKIVLKTPVETKEIYDTKTVNKIKRLVKDSKVEFLEIPRYVEPIKAAETMEVDELKLLKIEVKSMNLAEPTAKSVGQSFQTYLEDTFGTKFIIDV